MDNQKLIGQHTLSIWGAGVIVRNVDDGYTKNNQRFILVSI